MYNLQLYLHMQFVVAASRPSAVKGSQGSVCARGQSGMTAAQKTESVPQLLHSETTMEEPLTFLTTSRVDSHVLCSLISTFSVYVVIGIDIEQNECHCYNHS